MRSRDGGLQFGLPELCGEMLTTLDVVFLKMLPARAHTPRVTLGKLYTCELRTLARHLFET